MYIHVLCVYIYVDVIETREGKHSLLLIFVAVDKVL